MKQRGDRSRLLLAAVLLFPRAGATEEAPRAAAAPDLKAIEKRIEGEWKAKDFPSLSFAVVGRKGILAARSFGVADRESARPASPDTLYRIASITKVFTSTLLVVLRDRGVVRLDDPVARYLPVGVRLPADPRGAPAITLRHLATHTSGLPRLPVNLVPRGEDPYGGYGLEALLEGLSATSLDFPIGERYSYSNLGAGLLGHALERAAGEPYEVLLRREVLEPLDMSSTAIALPEDLRPRLAIGYRTDDPEKESVVWDLGCLAPAGGIISSVNDLAKFLALQLRAGKAGARPISGGSLLELHTPQRLTGGWKGAVGLGWHVQPLDDASSLVWHNGNVAGFYSYIAFAPRQRVGVILLANCGRPLEELGKWALKEAVARAGEEPPAEVHDSVRETARALVPFFVPEPPDALADHFHPHFLAEIPLSRLRLLFRGINEQFGPAKGVEIRAGENPRRATLLFQFAAKEVVRCDLGMDSGSPPKIIYLYFPPR